LVMGKPFDGKIDQYALAATVYELLAGAVPFGGPTGPAGLGKHTTEPGPSLAEAVPGLPAAPADAAGKGVAKDPAGRYPPCAALAKAVRAAAAGAKPKSAATGSTGTRRQGADATAPFAMLSKSDARLQPATRPRRTVLVAAAAGAGLTALAAGLSLWAVSGK